MTRQAYIQNFSPIAMEAVEGTRIFASIMMTLAILESSDKRGTAGKSILARLFNNHFAVKTNSSWSARKANLKHREIIFGKDLLIQDYFRTYNDPAHSFKDKVQCLLENKRNVDAGVFLAITPGQQADALRAAGYNTDPHFANTLKRLIARYNLNALDTRFSRIHIQYTELSNN